MPSGSTWRGPERSSAFYSGSITAYGSWIDNHDTCRPDPNLEKIGWFSWNAAGTTRPVRGLLPNAFGLYDMAGNVSEWNNDAHDGVGATSPTNPDGRVGTQAWRNVRGGMFDIGSSLCRMAAQSGAYSETNFPDLGFRLVRTVK